MELLLHSLQVLECDGQKASIFDSLDGELPN
jgi:hypothetical protein